MGKEKIEKKKLTSMSLKALYFSSSLKEKTQPKPTKTSTFF